MGISSIKILHLIASTGIGGAENVLLDICNSLKSKFQFKVGLFVNEGGEKESALANILADHHIVTHFIEMKYPPFYIGEIKDLITLYRKTDFSLVHCHGFRADVLGGIAARLCRIPAISSVHGWIAYSRKMRFYKWLDLKALHLFKAVLPVSNTLKQELLKNRIPLKKIQVLRNVPDLRRNVAPGYFDSPRRDGVIQIGYVGRLSPEKGIRFLIEALNRIKAIVPFYLHIVGDGPEMSEIVNKVKILGLEDRITIYGHVTNPEEIYKMLDILVLPSLTEGIPLTLLEGMSFGLAIIASKVGGIPEIIENNNNGLIVEPESVNELTEKITLLIKKPDLRERLGAKAKETIATLCDRDKWEQTLIRTYEQFGGVS